MKHKHAEKMLQYAQDAMETNKPWERWEYCIPAYMEWWQLSTDPGWFEDIMYRRKDPYAELKAANTPGSGKQIRVAGSKNWYDPGTFYSWENPPEYYEIRDNPELVCCECVRKLAMSCSCSKQKPKKVKLLAWRNINNFGYISWRVEKVKQWEGWLRDPDEDLEVDVEG